MPKKPPWYARPLHDPPQPSGPIRSPDGSPFGFYYVRTMLEILIQTKATIPYMFSVIATGRIVTKDNIKNLEEDEIDEWEECMEFFEVNHPGRNMRTVRKVLRKLLEEKAPLDAIYAYLFTGIHPSTAEKPEFKKRDRWDKAIAEFNRITKAYY